MKDFKNMSDNTVLRVRVPKALYESIKKELEKESVEEKIEETQTEATESYLEEAAPDPVDALINNQAFGIAAKSITAANASERFKKLMDALWNSIPSAGKSAVIKTLVNYAKEKATAPTANADKKDFGKPPTGGIPRYDASKEKKLPPPPPPQPPIKKEGVSEEGRELEKKL